MKNNLLSIITLVTFCISSAQAQEYNQDDLNKLNSVKPGGTHFMLNGYGFAGFEATKDNNSFAIGSFAPIFLFKPSDKLFFESELETEIVNGELKAGLEYADINYKISKNLTFRAGKFLLPFGTFGERLHPAWINRLPNLPLGFGHGGVGPMADVGIEIRGGLQLKNAKANYAFYLVNGATLNDGKNDIMSGGMLMYENFQDNNNNKTIGGRIGFLPFSNSSLEIGISGQYGKVGNRKTIYENVNALLYAVDISYTKSFEKIKSNIDFKGQINFANIDRANYADSMANSYTFNNNSQAYYMQLAFRPALLKNKVLQNIELVARYSALELPEKSMWGTTANQWAFGLNYWMTWRAVVKISYQTNRQGIMSSMQMQNSVIAQIAMGF